MIKKFIFGFVLFLLAQGIMAQTTDTIDCEFWWPEGEQIMWGVPEQMPNFPGGEVALKNYISERLVFPSEAKEAGVDIRLYSVIYNAIEDVENAMKGMLAPTEVEAVLGHVEIRELFKVSGVGTIGGCYVLDGKIVRNCGVRVVRDDVVVYTGNLGSLQRMKDAVKEVNAGYECGLSIEKFNDIKIGDIIESFEIREVART